MRRPSLLALAALTSPATSTAERQQQSLGERLGLDPARNLTAEVILHPTPAPCAVVAEYVVSR